MLTKRLPPGTHPRIRFWTKVNYDGDCWLWTGARTAGGYGQFKVSPGQAPVMAHRWAYEDTVGPIPAGLEIDHLCNVILCVRPDHLEPATPRANKIRSSGFSGKNARKTHCAHGHEYTAENTYMTTAGSRVCRTCARASGKRHRAKAKAK